MRNLDNSRPNGAQWDALAGATLREQPALFAHIYRVLLHAARAEGIGADRLPDFLGLAEGGELELLGQEELATMQSDDLIAPDDPEVPGPETERIRANAARVGQHVFARNVLSNCGRQCVFCGLRPAVFSAGRMLLAGHIKPWRDSSPKERLDPANGLAACPNHDVAFDTGLLTIQDDLQITLAAALTAAVRMDELTKRYYGRPPLLDALLLPGLAKAPAAKYLDWHRRYIFTGASRTRKSASD
jgi:putative restriction endonuclease